MNAGETWISDFDAQIHATPEGGAYLATVEFTRTGAMRDPATDAPAFEFMALDLHERCMVAHFTPVDVAPGLTIPAAHAPTPFGPGTDPHVELRNLCEQFRYDGWQEML